MEQIVKVQVMPNGSYFLPEVGNFHSEAQQQNPVASGY